MKYDLQNHPQLGGRVKICMKLTGLGKTLNSLVINGVRNQVFTEYSNHVWLPQIDKDTNKRINVCYNCKSVMSDGRFIPFGSEEKEEQKKEKKK